VLLLVVRSIAVYALTAGVGLWIAHRRVRPLKRGAALALAALPLLFTGPATFRGEIYAPLDIVYDAYPHRALRSEMGILPLPVPTLGDVVYQEIPWREAVRASVKRGELPLWNPHVLSGEPLLAVQQPAVLHPGTWIGFLLPLAQAWTFEMSLRIFLALLCGYLFFRELGLREAPAFLGATGWAFSNYLVFFLGYPLSPAVAPFPLLLLGLRRLARAPDGRASAIVVASLLLIVTSGHPETLLHAVAAAGLYFLWELLRVSRSDARRAILHSFAAGAWTLGLSAVLLLPLAEALPHTFEQHVRTATASRGRAMPWTDVAARTAFEVSPLGASVGRPRHFDDLISEASGYSGALMLPLALTGFLGRGRDRWFFALLGLLALSVAAYTPAADLLARLPLFDIAINDRLIFATAFSVCALAALGANRLLEGEGAAAFVAGSALTIAGLTVLFIRYRRVTAAFGLPDADGRDHFLMQVVPVLAALAVVVLMPRTRRAVAVVTLVALLLAQRRLEAGWFYPSFPARAVYPPLSVLDAIPRGEPWRFVALGHTLIPNAAALYGLEDIRGYEAMTFRPMFDTFTIWCTHQPIWFNRVSDPEAPFIAFLNARWVLAPSKHDMPSGWNPIAEGQGVKLYENRKVLPRAFVPRSLMAEPDPYRRIAVLASIHDFADQGVVSESAGAGWIPNGDADVAIREYATDRLVLDVRAREDALVATSIPAWPGWRVRLDGQRLPIVTYNHGFVAFRVPEGPHRIELSYRPLSVTLGAAISVASAVLAWIVLRTRRRNRSAVRRPLENEEVLNG
jgi:hypothetical protein